MDGRRIVGKSLRFFGAPQLTISQDLNTRIIPTRKCPQLSASYQPDRRSDQVSSSKITGTYWLVVPDWLAPPDTRKHYWSPDKALSYAARIRDMFGSHLHASSEMLIIMERRKSAIPTEELRVYVPSQVEEGHSRSRHVLRVPCYIYSSCPGPKVQRFFVDLNALALPREN